MAEKSMKVREEEFLLSVADVLLIDLESGMEYATATLASHNISQSVDTSEIRAGRNNAVIATLESNKTITVEVEDVHANRDWLAIAMDAELVEKEQFDVVVLPQTLKVENGAVKLSRTPKSGETILAYNKATGEAVNIAVDGKATDVEEGTIVLVASYKSTATKADVMEIGGEGAGRGFAMYLEESVFNNNMKVIATKTTYFPRVVPESSFTMEGSSELAEQNMTYTFTVSQGEGQTYLGQIIYVPVETQE